MRQITPGIEIRAFAHRCDRYQVVEITDGGRVELHQELVVEGRRTELPVVVNRAGKRAEAAKRRALAFVEGLGFYEVTAF